MAMRRVATSASNSAYSRVPTTEEDLELEDYDAPLIVQGDEDINQDENETDLVVRSLAIDFTIDNTANQRTQMAWVRTSLGMISLGLSLMHIFTKQAEMLALIFILLGSVYGVVSSFRFYMFFQVVETGKFRTNSLFVWFTSGFTLLSMLLLLILMYLNPPTASSNFEIGGGKK